MVIQYVHITSGGTSSWFVNSHNLISIIPTVKAQRWGVSYMFILKAGHTKHVPGYTQVRNKAPQQVHKYSQI